LSFYKLPTSEDRKIELDKWEDSFKTKEVGELGVKDIKLFDSLSKMEMKIKE